MANKGNKSSNIFQVLKSAGAWKTKDGTQPVIKNVGKIGEITSPLKKLDKPITPSTGVNDKSKAASGDIPGYKTANDDPFDKKGAAQKIRQNALNKASGKKMKDLAIGSQERHDEYNRRQWKHDETSKVKEKAKEVVVDEKKTTDDAKPVEKVTPKEVKVKTDNVTKAKAEVASAKEKKVTAKADLARAGGKTKKAARLDKRAKRIAKRKNKGTAAGNLIRKGVAAIRGKKGAAKDKAVQTQVAINEKKDKEKAAAV